MDNDFQRKSEGKCEVQTSIKFGNKQVAAIAKLSAAAKTGNADTLKAAFGATAATCKACRDDFQAKL